MQAMQYEMTLPADYDMRIIRERVAAKGHLLDAFPGLGLKAYLIREQGVAGSPVNLYGSFYLWNSLEGMNSFLWGPGFRGLATDFGRPVVRQWTGLALQDGPDRAGAVRFATRRLQSIGRDGDPAQAIAETLADLPARAGVHSTALAVDTSRWELVVFTLWTEQPVVEDGDGDGAGLGERYEVLHLSTPELEKLPRGRHW